MNTSSQQDGSSRVEREVLEILERAEASRGPVEQIHTAARRQSRSARDFAEESIPLAKLKSSLDSDTVRIGLSLVLAILAAATSDASRIVAIVLALASAALFFSLWFPSRGLRGGDSPRWRGRDLRDGPPRFGRGDNWPRRPSR